MADEQIELALAQARNAWKLAGDDEERVETIESLLQVWYEAWPPTALTSPHLPIAIELVRLLTQPVAEPRAIKGPGKASIETPPLTVTVEGQGDVDVRALALYRAVYEPGMAAQPLAADEPDVQKSLLPPWPRNSDLKRAVRDRDRDRCRYCGKLCIFMGNRSDDGLTYDYLDVKQGARLENLVVACRSCREAKNGRTPEEAGMVLLPAGTGPPPTQAVEPINSGNEWTGPEMEILLREGMSMREKARLLRRTEQACRTMARRIANDEPAALFRTGLIPSLST